MFAAHREGIISRPLWLSDWAWERGIDPVHVFLVLGGAAVVVLGLLLVAEAEERRGSAAAVLAIFAVLGVVLVVLIGPPKAEPDDRLGLTSPDPSGSASASAAPSPPRPPSSSQPDGGQSDAGPKPQEQTPDGGGKPQDGGDDGGAQPQDQNPDGGSQPQDQTPDGGQGDAGRGRWRAAAAAREREAPERERAGAGLAVADGGGAAGERLLAALAGLLFPARSVEPVERHQARAGFAIGCGSGRDGDVPVGAGAGARGGGHAEGREPVRAQVALLVEHTRPFALETPVAFGPLRNPNPSRFQRAYTFESLAQSIKYKELRGKKAGNPAWSDEVRAYYQQTTDDPRFAELAKVIHRALPDKNRGDPFVTAVAVKLFLDDNYKYSRKETHSGATDPTADFLFGNHIGYCVHFAHAAVLLWRALGLPARVGTGYAVEEKNRQGGSAMLIRASDAHAWPELYLEGVGWVVIDITPKESLDDSPPPVDDELQRLLGEMARQMPPDPTKTEPQPPVNPKVWLRPIGMFLGATAAALLVMLYLAKVWRRAAPLWARPGSLPRVGYRTSLDLLAEAGFARELGESREAFAERVRERLPTFERLTRMHLAGAARAAAGRSGERGCERGDGRRGRGGARARSRQHTPERQARSSRHAQDITSGSRRWGAPTSFARRGEGARAPSSGPDGRAVLRGRSR